MTAHTVYDNLLATFRQGDPAFVPQAGAETAQDFLKRIIGISFAALSDELYLGALTEEARAWLETATLQFNSLAPIDPPPGFTDAYSPPRARPQVRPVAVAEAPPPAPRPRPVLATPPGPEPEPPPPAPAVTAHPHAGGNGAGPEATGDVDEPPAPAVTRTPEKASRRQAPAAKPAKAARQAAPAPQPPPTIKPGTPPQRARLPEAARRFKSGFTVRSIRRMVIKNPNVTLPELEAEARRNGADLKRSTVLQQWMTTRNILGIMHEEEMIELAPEVIASIQGSKDSPHAE